MIVENEEYDVLKFKYTCLKEEGEFNWIPDLKEWDELRDQLIHQLINHLNKYKNKTIADSLKGEFKN